MLGLTLCPLVAAGGVIYWLWRISLPWDERDRPLFSFRRAERSAAPAPDPTPRTLEGATRLHPRSDLEADLTGWQAVPRKTTARFVARGGEVVPEKLPAPHDEGAMAFVSSDGVTLIAEPLPEDLDLAAMEAAATARRDTDDPRVHVLEGRGGLQFAIGEGRPLVLAFSRRTPRCEVVVDSLRLPGPATSHEPSLELRVVNDALLAALLVKRHDAAREQLAPGLHLVFVKKTHPGAATFELLGADEVAQAGGRASFLEKMRGLVDPAQAVMEGDGDLRTNREFNPHAATLVAQPSFFARLGEQLGPALLVGVPSVSRVLVMRDSPHARTALAAMLQAAGAVEGTMLLSTRVYRVTGADWSAWSAVDERN